MFLRVEKGLGRTPKTVEFYEVGLPPVGYFNREFGNFTNFLNAIGRKHKEINYRKKDNPKRFFMPQEYLRVIGIISKDFHRFRMELMLHTGARIDELRNIKVGDIDFEREVIFIRKPKGGRGKERTIQISSNFKNRAASYIRTNNLTNTDTFGIPSTQAMVKMIKKYVKDSGITDWEDFSCHTFRKTLEMWLIGLGVNTLAISAHMGHTIEVASAYYVSTSLFKQEDRSMARYILGDLLNK